MFLREHTETLDALPGVGQAATAAFGRLGIRTVADLLVHYPRRYEDRRAVSTLTQAAEREADSAVLVTVVSQTWFGPPRRKTLKILVSDDSGQAELPCFNRAYLARALPIGLKCYLWGKFSIRGGRIECSSFEHEVYSEHPRAFLRMVPVYPATEGLGQAAIRRALGHALGRALPDLEDEIPAALRPDGAGQGTAAALREVHAPATPESVDAARRSLAFEELVYLNLAIARRRESGAAVVPDPARAERRSSHLLREELIRRLAFRLTPDQVSAVEEIAADLRSPRPMRRLLQGDVGCGKTLVALLAALDVIQAGEQAALMAPTELLARQHAELAARLLEPLGVQVALLVAGVVGEARGRLLRALRAEPGESGVGIVDLVVGTHALFGPDVVFRNLTFVAIDEQQRFGVDQRASLARKGGAVDLLQMTATPIPRSLALTLFGDLELTEIRQMPPGRKPVITHLAKAANSGRVYERVRRDLRKGRQAYFVYPAIAAQEGGGVRDAERMYEHLRTKVYPDHPCALIHSRLPEAEKAARMAAFAAGQVSVLVATSVVEVGVDVPNATCMVVEHAERFGLASLHQLRGRVGRGTEQAYLFLTYADDLTEGAVGRLRVMLDTADGFRIAEEDLRLRGPGELGGVEQAGYLKLEVADPATDTDLMAETRRLVRDLLAADPDLSRPEHLTLRAVLDRAPRFVEGDAGSADESPNAEAAAPRPR